jgi:hypothetical protein
MDEDQEAWGEKKPCNQNQPVHTLPLFSTHLRELEVHLRGELQTLGPRGGSGRAEHSYDLVDFIHLAGSREERSQCVELGHDRPDGPQVDGGVVVCGAEQDLGGAGPARGDVVY